MRSWRAFCAGAVLVTALALPLSGCGGDSNGNMMAATPVRSSVTQGSFNVTSLFIGLLIPCANVAFVPFSTSGTGDIDVTVQWGSPSNDIDVAVASGSCNCNNVATCTEVASSDSTTAKPERLNVSGASAGGYTLVIANFGARSDSGTYEVGLTR